MEVRRVDDHDQQESQRLDQDVTLEAAHQLGRIGPARPPDRRLDRLAVEDRPARPAKPSGRGGSAVTPDSPRGGAAPLDQPIVCPVLIGRGPHLDGILGYIEQARFGRGRVVLVSGEAGIGKSRLVAEAQARVKGGGVRVLRGHCFEPDRMLPYAPLQDLLQAMPIEHSPFAIIDSLGPVAYDLVPLLPDLARSLPAVRRGVPLDPEHEKRRLFLALTHLFARHAAVGPLLAVIEDVHWSDDGSLDFVEYLARRIGTDRIVLLLTYRTDEVGARLSSLLTELDRSRVAAEVRLTRLARGDVDAMVRATFGVDRSVRPMLLDAIYGLTEGNPFFVEELLRSLVGTGASPFGEVGPEWEVVERLRIPRSVDEAVRRRFDGLSPAARQTITLAAVAGRRFDVPLLRELVGLDERGLLDHLKELLAAQLVVEESTDRFAFRHALTRQAIYSRLLALERRAHHQTIAETIERLRAGALETHLADLAYHTFEAGLWDKALDYGRRAGEAALRLHAAGAAVEHLGRAIAAAEELSRSQPLGLYARAHAVGDVPPDLYSRQGQAYEILGDFERARINHETALRLARDAEDRRAEWQALIDLGFLWAERDYARTGDFYRSASDLANTLGDPLLRARSLNRLGNWLTNVGQAGEALRMHREALTLFAAQGDDRGEAETLDLLGMTWGLLGDAIASAAHYDRAITLFRASGDVATLLSSLIARAAFCHPHATDTLFSPLTQRDECVTALEEAWSLARQFERPAVLAWAENVLGQVLGAYGEFGAALTHVRSGLRLAGEIDHKQWRCGAHCSFGVNYVAMLDPDSAVPHLEAGLALGGALGSAWWIGMAAGYLALAHLLAGAPSRAEAVLATAMPADGTPRNAGERRTVLAWGELALARGKPEEALRIADALIASAPGETRTQPIPRLLRLKGEALLALRRLDEAERALEDAKIGALQRGAIPLLWQVHRALVRVRLALRQPAAARRECAAARDVIAGLAASIHSDAERDRFAQAALASLPALPAPKPPPVRLLEAERFGGLTARERDVAARIALCKSNREIAARLFTAERTVASQVGSILAKLGFTSRAQIAVWAREHDLVAPE
jgi:DNA-binding CsgD family transcriptional regulator/tetratricopeptide (TPR) repeat protein